MSLNFAAIVPHPPILIPNIGKENLSRLKKTTIAYQKLEHDLYCAQVDSLIIISPHGLQQLEAFTLNLAPQFFGNFQDFGDFATKFSLTGDVVLAHKIRESLETKAPLQLSSQPNLDHGAAIPLYLLTQHLAKVKIIPLYGAGLDLLSHYHFGQLLKRQLLVNKNRIAVIASGDLSHRLTKNAPAGYNPKGKKFDQKLIDYLTNKKTEEILKLSPDFISQAGECGLKSIVILLGILSEIKYDPQLLSYQSPFGVGYLVLNFVF